MPLPSDEKLLALANDLVQQFDQLFGLHSGFRPAHAKGMLLSGIFTPAPEAKSLSRAPHFIRESTPVTVRFSNSTGVPLSQITIPTPTRADLPFAFISPTEYTRISSGTRSTDFPRTPARSSWNSCAP